MSIRSEYMKQRKRIQGYLSRYKRKGFYIDFNIPKIPKKITQGSINKLKKLTPKKLQENIKYVDMATGEILSFYRGKKALKKEIEQIKYDTSLSDIIISNFRSNIRNFNEYAQEILFSWLNTMIDKFGKIRVANMLEEGVRNGNILTYEYVYSNEQLQNYIARMIDYLPDAGELTRESITEALEMEEWYESYD